MLIGFTRSPLANVSSVIQPYLFDSADASLHILDFLADPVYKGFLGYEASDYGSVLDWTAYCSQPDAIFVSFAGFLGCLLYPNVTRNVQEGTLPASLSGVGFAGNYTNITSRWIRSAYTSCLPVYCASVESCSSTIDGVCEVGQLLTDGYELSAAGVANCWQSLCSANLDSVNPDIAGVGVLLSYLIQTIFALLLFCTVAALAAMMYWRSRPTPTSIAQLDVDGVERVKPRTLESHYIIVNAVLVDFHKAQCYLSLALQIATLFTLFSSKNTATTDDKSFLLIVCAEGLVPIVLSLYTIMLFGKASWYMIILSIITLIPASAAGGYIGTNILGPQSANFVGDGRFPAICGYTGPSSICSGLTTDAIGENPFQYAYLVFLVIMTLMDTFAIILVLWKVVPMIGRQLNKQKMMQPPGVNKAAKHHVPNRMREIGKLSLHALGVLILLGCLVAEFYFFRVMFVSAYIHWDDWSFGQIVGFTTWFGLLADFAYIEMMGLEKGLDYRFPEWLQVVHTTRQPATQHNKIPSDNHLTASQHKLACTDTEDSDVNEVRDKHQAGEQARRQAETRLYLVDGSGDASTTPRRSSTMPLPSSVSRG